MTVPVDQPLEEWAFSRALFPTRLFQKRCARKKWEERAKNQKTFWLFGLDVRG